MRPRQQQRPELSLYDPEAPRLRVRCEPEPTRKPEPYLAVYVVQHVHGEPGTVMDGEMIAKFLGGRAEDALDYAEQLVRDPKRLETLHTVKNADAVVVNNERGVEQGRFAILRVIPAPASRRTGWFWRMLGWK